MTATGISTPTKPAAAATGQPNVTLTYGYNAMNQVTSLSDNICIE